MSTHRKTMWAEMAPDVYGGRTCDQIVPQWSCAAEGDKGDSDTQRVLELAARTFPPGTKVEIHEPLCPRCGELRHPKFPAPKRGPLFSGQCECGFDWDAWARDRYS